MMSADPEPGTQEAVPKEVEAKARQRWKRAVGDGTRSRSLELARLPQRRMCWPEPSAVPSLRRSCSRTWRRRSRRRQSRLRRRP